MCKNAACAVTSCLHCKLAIDPSAGGKDHTSCAEVAPRLKMFTDALEAAMVPCPSCGLRGVKDGACTHMCCPSCGVDWCYFCGELREDCNGADEGEYGGFSGHNEEWDTRNDRCPMFLEYLSDSFADWPANPDACVEHLSKLRVLHALRRLYDNLT